MERRVHRGDWMLNQYEQGGEAAAREEEDHEAGAGEARPHGGVRSFRWGQSLGCYVTKLAPHEALTLIA